MSHANGSANGAHEPGKPLTWRLGDAVLPRRVATDALPSRAADPLLHYLAQHFPHPGPRPGGYTRPLYTGRLAPLPLDAPAAHPDLAAALAELPDRKSRMRRL